MISAIVVLISTEDESQLPSPSCNDETQITIVGTRHFADAARIAHAIANLELNSIELSSHSSVDAAVLQQDIDNLRQTNVASFNIPIVVKPSPVRSGKQLRQRREGQ
jgi:hypothetical protein